MNELYVVIIGKNKALQPTKEKKMVLFICEILQCRLNMKAVCSGHVDIGYLRDLLKQSVEHISKTNILFQSLYYFNFDTEELFVCLSFS